MYSIVSSSQGWRTFILLQFQPQYLCIILMGIFVTAHYVLMDFAFAVAFKDKVALQQAQSVNLMLSFDGIYLIDIISMVVLKIVRWPQVKNHYNTRSTLLVTIEFISLIPLDMLYRRISHSHDLTYFVLRLRYAVRLLRFMDYFKNARNTVGIYQILLGYREMMTYSAMIILFEVIVIYWYMGKEGRKAQNYTDVLMYLTSQMYGKGIPSWTECPHSATVPLYFFIFIAYVLRVYYTSFIVCANMQAMREQFFYINTRAHLLESSWKQYSGQLFKTATDFYKLAWQKRHCLEIYDKFDEIIPEIMTKEITLDLCWAAFKHSHIFREVEVHYLRYLASKMQITFLTPGELIYVKGKFKSKMVYIASGVVELLSEEDGETPILYLTGGTCLGEASLFMDQPSVCTVVCHSYSEICVLNRKDLMKSHEMYPHEFAYLTKLIFQRCRTAQKYMGLNKLKLQNTEWFSKRHTVTMKWLKRVLPKLQNKVIKVNRNLFVSSKLEDRIYDEAYELFIFCAKYLDLIVMADENELIEATTLVKSTCPIIFLPNSPVMYIWDLMIAGLAYILGLTYMFYLCLATDYFTLYSLFVYTMTVIWMCDVYVTTFCAIRDKSTVITDIKYLVKHRMRHITFYLDVLAAFPLEIFGYMLVGNAMSVPGFHYFKLNRLLKVYKTFRFIDITNTNTPKELVLKKYLKLVLALSLFLINTSGIWYLLMCTKTSCSSSFEGYLERRFINIHSGFHKLVECAFLVMEFNYGLFLGEYPIRQIFLFLLTQITYYLSETYFVADLAAAECLKYNSKLAYHEFVGNVKFIIKEWKFSTLFKKRVLKYCYLQYEWDHGAQLLRQPYGLSNIPKALHKIGLHILFGRTLKHIPLFQNMDDWNIANICKYLERVMIPEGEVITYAGEICKEMYIIENGYCEMIAQSRTTAKTLGPGDTFSVIEMILNVPIINTVITLTDCKMLVLTQKNFFKAMRLDQLTLHDIEYTTQTSINWVAFEQLQNKECLDIESYCKEITSYTTIGYQLDRDTKEYDEYHTPFDKTYFLKFMKYVLLRVTFRPHGKFVQYWEIGRCIFAFFTVILNPITVISGVKSDWWYFLLLLDITAVIDIYYRHHIGYFDKQGIEVTHPLKTALYYWSHGFLIDALGVMPSDIVVPYIVNVYTAKATVYTRMNRLLQYARIHNCLNYYIRTTGNKVIVLAKYFFLMVFLVNIMSSIIINNKCVFDHPREDDKLYVGHVYCVKHSYLSPKSSLKQPVSPMRVYGYGLYFVTALSVTLAVEGFSVILFRETCETLAVLIFWIIITTYFFAKIIGQIIYRNAGLVIYQNAMKSLVHFMSFRKIDPRLKNEIINHYEYIWLKKKGQHERVVFHSFNTALQEDALFNIFGKVLQDSSIFKGASKSFIKSLLLNVKHEMILKRGIVSQVNNVNDTLFFLFKGVVDILGPDYRKLLVLGVGSVFGHLDNIDRSRQTLTFVAKGHIEVLTIPTLHFHGILSKYRELRSHFKALTILNVDYLLNENTKPLDTKKSFSQKQSVNRATSSRLNNLSSSFWCRDGKCCRCQCNVLRFVYKRNKFFKIWEFLILFGVCFIGTLIEVYQKSAEDMVLPLLIYLYINDFIYVLKIFLQFHTAYDDDRGLLVTDIKAIAKRYLKAEFGFWLDICSVIPIELFAFCFTGSLRTKIWTIARIPRLIRILLVFNYFHQLKQKLNVNVFLTRSVYLLCNVIITLTMLTSVLFIAAKYDPTLEHFNIIKTKNAKVMTYFSQLKVLLSMFTGTDIETYIPNTATSIFLTLVFFLCGRFYLSYFIAENCTTLEIVYYNKTYYDIKIQKLKRALNRNDISRPLLMRVWVYVKLLWKYHKGVQFPTLIEQAPYYLREGVLNSMFGYLLRRHPLLRKCHVDMLRQIAAQMRTRVFFTGDFITFMGDVDQCMYFIHSGEVEVLGEDTLYSEIIKYTLRAGEMFGFEQGMYKKSGHEYTYRAKKKSLIIMLHRSWWIHLLEFFPGSKKLIYNKDTVKTFKSLYNLGGPIKPRLNLKSKLNFSLVQLKELN